MSDEPLLKRVFRVGLIGIGATSMASSVMGVITAYKLMEPSDAKDVGLTPGDFVGYYAVMFAIGAGLLFAGFRLRKKKK